MIFVTTGLQLPFHRLSSYMYEWSLDNAQEKVVIQSLGVVLSHKSRQVSVFSTIDERQYMDLIDEAEVVVGHAGTGTIISALIKGKPMILMPRRAMLNEHVNDHQKAAVDAFASMKGVYFVESKEGLFNLLENKKKLLPSKYDCSFNRNSLLGFINEVIY